MKQTWRLHGYREDGWFSCIDHREVVVIAGAKRPIVPLKLTETPDGPYWGWVKTGSDELTLVQNDFGKFDMQFPHQAAPEVKHGRGRIVRLAVTEVPDDGSTWAMYALRATSQSGDTYYSHPGSWRHVTFQRIDLPIVEIELTAQPEGSYWGCIQTGRITPVMIQPNYPAFSVQLDCRPNEWAAKNGRIVRLDIREVREMGDWRRHAYREDDFYSHFFGDQEEVADHGLDLPIVPVRLRESPDGPYWGWIETESTEVCLVQPFRTAFEAQFDGKQDADVALGRGRIVRLQVTELAA